MRELTLQVEDSKYNQLLQFLTTIDYIKILNDLQQTKGTGTTKKVSSTSASAKQKIVTVETEAEKDAKERAAKISALWGSISKEDGEDFLRQTAQMRDEWERQF